MGEILLTTEYAVSRSPQLSNAQLLNFLTERQPQEAAGRAPLIGCPGIKQLGEIPAAANDTGIAHRGAWNFNGAMYVVAGVNLYSVSSSGGYTLVGSGITGTGRVSMSDNGTQLCIVNGAAGWIYTVADGLTQITSSAFYPADTVFFMDGYFIFDRAGTNEWFLSALFDGLTYNGLDFASAEGLPGLLTGVVTNLQLLFIICSGHIELWYDAGSADFPFQRYSGGIIDYGCTAPFTIIKQDGAIFFLGADKVFYRLQGNVPIRVSSHPIETALQTADDLTDAFCTTYTWEGHKVVNLTVPAIAKTFSFDISTEKWHERGSVDSDFTDLGVGWRAATLLQVYNGTYVGDATSGKVGLIDTTTYTEFGNPIMGLIASMNQQADRRRVYCSRFELKVQAGVGLATGQGSDPQIMLRRSTDGGMTWSTQQPWRSMGQTGEYDKRLRWMAQGQGRQLMWQLTVTDPVPRAIIGAYADLSEGMP